MSGTARLSSRLIYHAKLWVDSDARLNLSGYTGIPLLGSPTFGHVFGIVGLAGKTAMEAKACPNGADTVASKECHAPCIFLTAR